MRQSYRLTVPRDTPPVIAEERGISSFFPEMMRPFRRIFQTDPPSLLCHGSFRLPRRRRYLMRRIRVPLGLFHAAGIPIPDPWRIRHAGGHRRFCGSPSISAAVGGSGWSAGVGEPTVMLESGVRSRASAWTAIWSTGRSPHDGLSRCRTVHPRLPLRAPGRCRSCRRWLSRAAAIRCPCRGRERVVADLHALLDGGGCLVRTCWSAIPRRPVRPPLRRHLPR